MRTQKPKSEPGGLRDKLSEDFLRAIQSDFQVHGPTVIEQLRQKYPQHYSEIVARLTASTEEPSSPTDFSGSLTRLDIGMKLLQQLGLHEDAITIDMAERAATANDVLVDCLEEIAQGN
jgi:hypothetical protein